MSKLREKFTKNSRIDSETVNRPLQTMNKLLSPSNAAKTTKPMMDHIDLEIAETLKHQQRFDLEIQKEYEKLHFPINYYLDSKSPKTPKKRIFRVLSAAETKSPSTNKRLYMNKREKTDSPKTVHHKKSAAFSNTKNTSPLFQSFQVSCEKLPPLVKSTPLHLDPKFKFLKKAKFTSEKINGRMLNSVDTIIENCKRNTKSRIGNFQRGIKFLQVESNDISTFIDDLIDSVKFTKNDEKVENIMLNRKHNRKIDVFLKNESKTLQRELNESTKKIMRPI